MATEVYGASDDLIEVEGDVMGEVNHMSDKPALVRFSDGTVLSVVYGKPGNHGVWWIRAIERGALFDRIDECFDENADRYSDTAHFRDGLTGATYRGKKVR
jgi:hypothetical protein